jgi:hypothetical protein
VELIKGLAGLLLIASIVGVWKPTIYRSQLTRKHFIIATFVVFVLIGILPGNKDSATETIAISNETKGSEDKTQTKAEEKAKTEADDAAKKNTDEKEQVSKTKDASNNDVNTEVFMNYAEKVEAKMSKVTNHLDVVITLPRGGHQGNLITSMITNTYYFLEQEDVMKAKTATFGFMMDDLRIFQYTTDVEKFNRTKNDTFIESIFGASKIEKMNDGLKEYGEVMGRW